jgi:hypothetical protein
MSTFRYFFNIGLKPHIPCGLQAGVPEEAHGICALAGFKFLDDRQTAHGLNLFHADHRA